MKEKILKVLTSKYAQCVYSMLMAFGAVSGELRIGSSHLTAWIIGLCVSVGFGLLWEVFRYIMLGEKSGGFQWKNITAWVVGCAFGVAAAYVMGC